MIDQKEPRIGLCLFCDKVDELTDEDLVSIWVNKALTQRSGRAPKVAFSSRRVDGDQIYNLDRKLSQTYSVIKIPDICKSCNNGWMSVIDNEASKIIKPMLAEDRRFGLPVSEQTVLSRWLALKTLLADLIDDQNCVFLPDDFHAFYADQNPPPRFRASLARIDTQGEDINLFIVQPLLRQSTASTLVISLPSSSVSASPLCTSIRGWSAFMVRSTLTSSILSAIRTGR